MNIWPDFSREADMAGGARHAKLPYQGGHR